MYVNGKFLTKKAQTVTFELLVFMFLDCS